jgi:hypothetical protein
MCVGGNWLTGRKADVVEGELANPGVELEEERERLADTTGGTEDGDLGGLQFTRLALTFPIASTEAFTQQQKAVGLSRSFGMCAPGGPTQRKRGAGPGRKLAWQRT